MTPYQHLNLLLRWDRTVGLQAALRQAVKPGAFVLDAGCGSGLLTLLALQAGAKRVVAVDLVGVDLARQLAEENGVADRVEFIEADLRTLEGGFGRRFDVIFGMLYLNDPRRDEGVSQVAYDLRDRFLASGGSCIPGRVRYSAQPCEWPEQDITTRQHNWQQQITEIEGRHGLRFQGLLERIQAGPPDKEFFPQRFSHGKLYLAGARLLGPPSLFTELDYCGPRTDFPEVLQVQLDAPGVFNTIIWRQELWYDQVLIFANESVSWLQAPQCVEPGQQFTLTVDDRWRRTNVLHSVSNSTEQPLVV